MRHKVVHQIPFWFAISFLDTLACSLYITSIEINVLRRGEIMKPALKNVIVLILVGMMCSGCAFIVGAAAGGGVVAGSYEYVKGVLKRPYAASMGTAWMACQDAMTDLGIEIVESSTEEPTQWTMKGITQKGKKITIALDMVSKDITKISVRVGVFGDKILSEKVHDTIARQLKAKV